MYIKKVKIKNVRAIEKFEMSFPNPAGWHVLIGDNGAGKSTIIRTLALALVGSEEIIGIQPDWNNWLKWNENSGGVTLTIKKDKVDIWVNEKLAPDAATFDINIHWNRVENKYVILDNQTILEKYPYQHEFWRSRSGWFSAGYGPFRRFTGGSSEKDKVFPNPSFSKLASHLSLFGEDVALSEATNWLMNLKFQTLEVKISSNILENLKTLINSPDFLPHHSQLIDISSDGVIFKDGNGAQITVTQMSDGYRSILSLTFELLRQLIRVYGEESVFKKVQKGIMEIDVPGVVLIDEIDAHLHPTWQTRIGQWFTKFFPKIQFIVTTHSPLVCRAAEKGSIWRLAAPGSENPSGEVLKEEKEKLLYGNILDAYGTELFGDTPVKLAKTDEKAERLGQLNILKALGKINKNDDEERNILLKTLSSL
ncbi:MAG: AAA family ATPase [Saprospiraceae bacterium]|nr:AAA family ATPase [Saprospiraceae bacterium]